MPIRKLVLLVLCALLTACASTSDPVDSYSSAEALVSGPPRIISTTLDAPIVGGRYQLEIFHTYTARVIVDAGTIGYLVRIRPDNLSSAFTPSPLYRDDSIAAYSGQHAYAFQITPNNFGDYQVAFFVQDRGTWNIYDHDGGVAVRVPAVPPRIVSTTLNAPIVNGRYQLNAGLGYTATVVVASGNVTYDAEIEAHDLASGISLSPTSIRTTVDRASGNHSYSFGVAGSTLGTFQLGFQLRDHVTRNVFNVDGGVALDVNSSAPRIVSTRIVGVTQLSGIYPLEVGRRYQVEVQAVPGAITYRAAARPAHEPPEWIHLRNKGGYVYTVDHTRNVWTWGFTITPMQAGDAQLAFALWDEGTTNLFGPESGIHVVASAAESGFYGVVTSAVAHTPIPGATVQADDGSPPVTTDNVGHYHLAASGTGTRTLTVTRGTDFSPTKVINVPLPATRSDGIRIDVDLEDRFVSARANGKSYTRYIDYLRGRTLLHTVRVAHATSHVEVVEGSATLNMYGYWIYQNGVDIADATNADVLINGGFFGGPDSLYYTYHRGMGSCLPGNGGVGTILGITGVGTGQTLRIAEKYLDFNAGPQSLGDPYAWAPGPIWDDNHDGVSDVDWALQVPGLIYRAAPEFFYTQIDYTDDFGKYWPRTAVGVTPNGDLDLVIADGEGITYAQGASLNELAFLFRDQLGDTIAMNFDGGGSTKMVLRDASGAHRLVDTPTSENPDMQRPDDSGVLNFLIAR